MARPRKDFVIVWNRAFTDERFDRFGAHLVKMKLALPVSASDTARSLSARLWAYLIRLNDRRGILPGNGLQAARAAFGLGPKEAGAVLAGMSRAGLLSKEAEGLWVLGFEETYEPLYRERDRDCVRKSGGNSRGNSQARTAPTVTGHDRTEVKGPPLPPHGGDGGGEAGMEDPPEPASGLPADLRLSSPQRAELHAEGLSLRRRAGREDGWEKAIQLLVHDLEAGGRLAPGEAWRLVVDRLKATKAQLSLPPHLVFAPLQGMVRNAGAAQPAGTFAGVGKAIGDA
jgi:hypothetical protein